MSYQSYLRAIGREPIPAYDKLRTPRAHGDVELPPVSKPWWNAEPASYLAWAGIEPVQHVADREEAQRLNRIRTEAARAFRRARS